MRNLSLTAQAVHFQTIKSAIMQYINEFSPRTLEMVIKENSLLFAKYKQVIYKNVVDSASDTIITICPDGKILSANKTAEKMFGYKNEELIGESLKILIAESAREYLQASIELFLTNQNYDFAGKIIELPGLTKYGREFTVEASFGDHFAGEERLYTAVIRDVTERKETEEALIISAQYEHLLRHINDAIIIFEPENETVLDVNDYACKMYGFSRHEFLGKSLQTISQNVAGGRRYIDRLLARVEQEAYESVHFHKNGSPINVVLNASLIEFQEQKAVLCIIRDVTHRTRANAALRESEKKFRNLIENMSEGLLELDQHERIIFTNARFCEMTGYASEELIGRIPSDFLLDDEGREIVRQANSRRRKGVSDAYELKVIRKNGEPLWAIVGGVPLTDKDGKIVGSMGIHTDITERKLAEERLLHNAMHDSLTGLPNRALFLEHLRRAMSRSPYRERSFAVLFLDFDGFKLINDSLGHAEGDNLLKLIAGRLEALLRGNDIVARLGGDEFTILLDELNEPEDVLNVVRRIQDVLTKPFALGGRDVFISASIGIALKDEKYKLPEEILRDADIAMYRAKSAGKARHEIFNHEMHEQVSKRLRLETELRLAFERGEFRVFYQPIMHLTTNRLIGFESLIRWFHPERGQILPNDFIPIAEETGLIVPIGEWVLRESCRQIGEWQRRFPEKKDLHISVNLSCKQFIQHDLADRVAAVLLETGLDAKHLRLEVTESHVMENSQAAIKIMNSLRELGVRLSIDDFGTGYSSLSYLQRLPIDFLKIDRSFVDVMNKTMENSEIVKAIVMLAKNLGMDVIAEGIETREQAASLINLECTFGQGYFYSRPTDAAQAEQILAESATITLPPDDSPFLLEMFG